MKWGSLHVYIKFETQVLNKTVLYFPDFRIGSYTKLMTF